MNNSEALFKAGQSLWYDNIERSMLENGEIAGMIARREIYGITSNPSIFEKAIGTGKAYDPAIQTMAWAGLDKEQIYSQLVIADIQKACDAFSELYIETKGNDGFVSLEVSPLFAHNTEATIAEARALWAEVRRGNLMIKVPATLEGLPAVTTLISEGINVNVTLIFSVERYQAVMEAYLRGLELRFKTGGEINRVRSVASFFVSRIDSAIDKLLEAHPDQAARNLEGKIAIANTKAAYAAWLQVAHSDRFNKLAALGATMQRPLWASTGTKNHAYSPTLYVDNLTAGSTVNTVPPATLKAFLANGRSEIALNEGNLSYEEEFNHLHALKINLNEVTQALEEDGVDKFISAYKSLLTTIEAKRLQYENGLVELKPLVRDAIQNAAKEVTVRRLFDHDPTLWTADTAQHDEIRDRLGWLELPSAQLNKIDELNTFRQTCLTAGFTDVFVLGMGGSSLAPEVLSLTLAKSVQPGQGLRLQIIDTSNPDEIQAREASVDLKKALFIVASKSGSTSETNAALHYFWKRLVDLGVQFPGDQFIAITDPGTSLQTLAREKRFMRIFNAPPNVGGRYSVFTEFGLVPAALMGIDLHEVLTRAAQAQAACAKSVPYALNPGLVLGLTLAEAAKTGKNKLTFLMDKHFAPFGAWLEQLIAESSGKNGKGVLPVESEPILDPNLYQNDRIFVDMRIDKSDGARIQALINAGHPVLSIHPNDEFDLAAQFYLWEYATAILCAGIGVNAFDQPNVQESKNNTKNMIKAFQKTGTLDEDRSVWENEQGSLYGHGIHRVAFAGYIQDAVANYLSRVAPSGFIAINAYLERLPEMQAHLNELRRKLVEKYHCAVTLGYGPRFQHSTGQLHKGGFPGGYFIVLTKDPDHNMEIPEENMSFGTLQRAQALGDMASLEKNCKPVMRIHLKGAKPDSLV